MIKDEALEIIETCLGKYRQSDYSELILKIGKQEIFEGFGRDGRKYQIEIDFFFDDEITKNLRVTAMISYSLVTDFSPIVSDFIIAPNGKFIGE